MKLLNQASKILLVITFFTSAVFAGEKEVSNAVNLYVKNAKAKEVSAVEKMIDNNADFIRMNNIINEKKMYGKGDFLDIVKSGTFCTWASDMNVKVLDYQNDMALACIEYENSKLIQKEYLTLVFNNDNWQIVSSVCSLSKK